MRKRLLSIAALAIVFIAAIWYYTDAATVPAAPEAGVTHGKTAPGFTLNKLDGTPVTVGKPGKITVLNFWTTWCPPCREEMPELEKFSQKYRGNVLFAAINLQEPPGKVRAYLDQNGFSMPVLLDEDGRVGGMFAIRAIPTTIILDLNGVIKFRKSGPVTSTELETVIAELTKG
jgi:thiol-disulfide isomerase/thioredoxin